MKTLKSISMTPWALVNWRQSCFQQFATSDAINQPITNPNMSIRHPGQYINLALVQLVMQSAFIAANDIEDPCEGSVLSDH
jgi:hypothetical protein